MTTADECTVKCHWKFKAQILVTVRGGLHLLVILWFFICSVIQV